MSSPRNSFVRGIIFTLAFYATTAGMAILGLPSLLMPRAALYFWQRVWAAITAWQLRVICGIDHAIEDARPPSQRAAQVIYAVKHQSAWDGIVLFAYLGAPVVVLKKSLLFLPVFGLYLLRSGVIAIDRSRATSALTQIINKTRRTTATQRSMLIFPQGTRVAPGAAIRYHSGVFAMYAESGLPVVPVALNSGYFWPRNAWRRVAGTIRVRVLPPIAPGLGRGEFMRRLETVLEGESRALAPSPAKQNPKQNKAAIRR